VIMGYSMGAGRARVALRHSTREGLGARGIESDFGGPRYDRRSSRALESDDTSGCRAELFYRRFADQIRADRRASPPAGVGRPELDGRSRRSDATRAVHGRDRDNVAEIESLAAACATRRQVRLAGRTT
jgi:hypothetical protein